MVRSIIYAPGCLPRVCMGGSPYKTATVGLNKSAPRVHGWFFAISASCSAFGVCPACAWVVPSTLSAEHVSNGLPRVCMGGSKSHDYSTGSHRSAPRVHGWFQVARSSGRFRVCPSTSDPHPPSRYKPLTRLNNRNVRCGGIYGVQRLRVQVCGQLTNVTTRASRRCA